MSALVTYLVATSHPFAVLGYGVCLGVILDQLFCLVISALFRRRATPGTRRGRVQFIRPEVPHGR